MFIFFSYLDLDTNKLIKRKTLHKILNSFNIHILQDVYFLVYLLVAFSFIHFDSVCSRFDMFDLLPIVSYSFI